MEIFGAGTLWVFFLQQKPSQQSDKICRELGEALLYKKHFGRIHGHASSEKNVSAQSTMTAVKVEGLDKIYDWPGN